MLPVMAAVARAAEKTIVVSEQLGKEWEHELVSYPVEFPDGACRPESVRLKGPRGPVACQLSDVVYWPGSRHVKTARLWFVVDELKAMTTEGYVLAYGPQAARSAEPGTDLTVTRKKDAVELGTSRFGVRMPLMEHRFGEGASASDVPGPVVAMRLEDGTWFGGSRLYGDRQIRSVSTNVVAAGPVFAEVAVRYSYVDGMTMDLRAQLAAGDNKVLWDMLVRDPKARPVESEEDWPTDGWHLLLSPGLDPLEVVIYPEAHHSRWGQKEYVRGKWVFQPEDVELAKQEFGELMRLVPWRDWWDETTKICLTFKTESRGPFLALAARDPGSWMEPAAPGTWVRFSDPRVRDKWVPLIHEKDGTVLMKFRASVGWRRWFIGGPQPLLLVPARQGSRQLIFPGTETGVRHRFNEVKEYVLEWERNSDVQYPHLFLSREQLEQTRKRVPADTGAIEQYVQRARADTRETPCSGDSWALQAYLLSGSNETAEETRLVWRLGKNLALLGQYDLMRWVGPPVALFDTLIDSDLVSERQRRVFRAQMAFLGYVLADPAIWSIERGYCSGNPNMSVSYILNLGMVACVIQDHPMAGEWIKPAERMMDKWLGQVGPNGEWYESVTNYAFVSVANMLAFAVAAKNAGYHDYVNDPRMKRLMLYLVKQYTPPDPREGGKRKAGVRALPPSGRSWSGRAWGLAGVMARAIAADDPAYSRVMQWAWLQTGQSREIIQKLSGYETVYQDPTLPAEVPDWGSELFPQVCAILRHGLGTKDEWYLNFVVCLFSDWFESESGAFATIFAKGAPIAARFAGGYAEREELFMSRVHLARRRGTDEERRQRFCHTGERQFTAFSALPRQDYVAADFTIEEPRYINMEWGPLHNMKPVPEWPPVPEEGRGPVGWRRQVLFVKDADPAGASYLVLRDTVTGRQPTMWQFWTISERIGTAEQARDLGRFLADKPGDRIMPYRELKGDRLTAIGQFGVDVEFYIASPSDTPRYTLRWGTSYLALGGFKEYMDLLHLQMPGDGAYFVALYPRRRSEPVPTFETLGEGTVIKVTGGFGSDYAFLSGEPTSASAGDATFRGTAASVQDRKDGLVLSLGAKGEAAYRDVSISCDAPASIRLPHGRRAEVMLPDGHTGTQVRLKLPGDYLLASGTVSGVSLTASAGGLYLLSVPGDIERVVLVPQ